jgi:Leucine-rich repeat (LRR) protein
LLILVVLAVPGLLPAAAPPTKSPVEGPASARVVVTGTDQGGATSSMGISTGGKTTFINLSTRILRLNDKTDLLVVVDRSKVKIKEGAPKQGTAYALSGRLVVEGPGVNTGFFRLRTGGMLTVKGDKAVVLLADTVTPLDDKTRKLFPSLGKVSIEGRAVRGKRDPKQVDKPTLTIQNKPAAILLSGQKARLYGAGKGLIRATGALTVDKQGRIRLQADDVVTGLKWSLEARAEDAIEELGGSVTRAVAEGRPVVGVALALPNVADKHLAHLEAFPTLEDLDLSESRVSDAGLRLLKILPNLQTLSLGKTRVTGKGLKHLRGLIRLRTLNLRETGVTDAGLAHLAGLTKLESLDLSGTGVTVKGLKHLKGWTNLKALSLADKQVNDDMLAALVRAGRLHLLSQAGSGNRQRPGRDEDITSLSLSRSAVTDAGLVHVEGLTGLQRLYLSGAQATREGLKHLKELTRLQMLSLPSSQLNDEVLAALAQADKLQTLSGASDGKGGRPTKAADIASLSLSNTPMTDAGLEHLKGLTNLEKLYLYNSRMTGKGLAHLEKLARLRYLYLNTKQITDEVLGGLARANKLHALTGASAAKGERPAKDAEIVSLSLSQAPVTDAGLEHLKGLTNLEKLYLYKDRLALAEPGTGNGCRPGTPQGFDQPRKALPLQRPHDGKGSGAPGETHPPPLPLSEHKTDHG